MDRAAGYLRIPEEYAARPGAQGWWGGLRWSAGGEAIEHGDGTTFAFTAEVLNFLEGFAAQRPLVHFGFVLHLLHVLRRGRSPLARHPSLTTMSWAFNEAGHDLRNAGAFSAVLCSTVPSVAEPPTVAELWKCASSLSATHAEGGPQGVGEALPLPPEDFDQRLLHALTGYDAEEMVHWFRHGRGPLGTQGGQIAEAVVALKPPSLHGLLATLTQHHRLAGAVPFVSQLVSALTLPPRRLQQPELPLGGYSDVTTRGNVEQILPSQFAFDSLEFVRRHAEHELLYFRREEPQARTRDDLVVLLDQGVRTWGTVRLVLTAALFALGQLAERRKVPFRVAATSTDGLLCDPLEVEARDLADAVEASDLSPNPGLALERVLEEETTAARDVVLLTHPRNLLEPDMAAAACRLRPGARLFAVAVDEHGEVQFSQVRHGVPLILNRFHVDLDRTLASHVRRTDGPFGSLTSWTGDIEPIGFPFRFGIAGQHGPFHFAFDAAGEWLLLATLGGMLHAMRTDGSRMEVLPRGMVEGTVLCLATQVLGVAGGFVVIGQPPGRIAAVHYDFETRTIRAHLFERLGNGTPRCHYLRKLHVLVIHQGMEVKTLHLSTGTRNDPPAARTGPGLRLDDVSGQLPLQSPQAEGEPSAPQASWSWPAVYLNASSGTVALSDVVPSWETFTPLVDGQPMLKDCELLTADCQRHTLALLVKGAAAGGTPMLRLFGGPQGIPLASYPQSKAAPQFALSGDGRLLARQVSRSQVEVRDVHAGGRPLCVSPVGRFHPDVQVELGDCWLTIQIDRLTHLVWWHDGGLSLSQGRGGWRLFVTPTLLAARRPIESIVARPGPLPDFLPRDAWGRFRRIARGRLLVLVDVFGEVCLLEPAGRLVCQFFAFRQQIAAWMPDGTCLGSPGLLGRPATPGAAEKIGRALLDAWQRNDVVNR
jgi:hypothetical protein